MSYRGVVNGVACVLPFVATVSAQNPSRSDSLGLVFPTASHPLCVQVVDELIQHFEDGSVATKTKRGTIARDQSGRMRTEWVSASRESSVSTITLVDPIEGFVICLEPASKTGIRMSVPTSQADQFGLSLPAMINPLPDGDWKIETGIIEKRTIKGIEFEGTRITYVSEDRPLLKMSYEWWTSKSLGLVGSAIASGPNGTHEVRVQHIDWGTPDPSLFTVPPGYMVRELSGLDIDRE